MSTEEQEMKQSLIFTAGYIYIYLCMYSIHVQWFPLHVFKNLCKSEAAARRGRGEGFTVTRAFTIR